MKKLMQSQKNHLNVCQASEKERSDECPCDQLRGMTTNAFALSLLTQGFSIMLSSVNFLNTLHECNSPKRAFAFCVLLSKFVATQ
jgi:hypothetical protein